SQALVTAIAKLAAAREIKDIVETLRTTARNVMGSDGISVVLRDGPNCHYVEEDAVGPLWKGQRFPLETCISGWAMINKETSVNPDIFKAPRIPHAVYREKFPRALVMAPIGDHEPVAAMGAYWAEFRAPAPEEVKTLEMLAAAAATAFENVFLINALSTSLRR